MYGGEISENIGSGVGNDEGGAFNMYGGEISGNTANHGAGVRNSDGGIFNMHNGSITNNIASTYGGGIYVSMYSVVYVSGGNIAGNSAGREGGGIFTEYFNGFGWGGSNDYSDLTSDCYQNLTIGVDTVFSGNSAGLGAFNPPAIAGTYTNIEFASSSIIGGSGYVHLINNYDINFVGLSEDEFELFRVTYDANGGVGSHTVGLFVNGTGHTVLTLPATEIEKPGYDFTGWSMEVDGSGSIYSPGDTIVIYGMDVVLFAQWELVYVEDIPGAGVPLPPNTGHGGRLVLESMGMLIVAVGALVIGVFGRVVWRRARCRY